MPEDFKDKIPELGLWTELTKHPDFKALSTSSQDLVKQRFFKRKLMKNPWVQKAIEANPTNGKILSNFFFQPELQAQAELQAGEEERNTRVTSQGMIPFSKLTPEPGILRGLITKPLEGLTSLENAGLMVASAVVPPLAGLAALKKGASAYKAYKAVKATSAITSGLFAAHMAVGLAGAIPKATKEYVQLEDLKKTAKAAGDQKAFDYYNDQQNELIAGFITNSALLGGLTHHAASAGRVAATGKLSGYHIRKLGKLGYTSEDLQSINPMVADRLIAKNIKPVVFRKVQAQAATEAVKRLQSPSASLTQPLPPRGEQTPPVQPEVATSEAVQTPVVEAPEAPQAIPTIPTSTPSEPVVAEVRAAAKAPEVETPITPSKPAYTPTSDPLIPYIVEKRKSAGPQWGNIGDLMKEYGIPFDRADSIYDQLNPEGPPEALPPPAPKPKKPKGPKPTAPQAAPALETKVEAVEPKPQVVATPVKSKKTPKGAVPRADVQPTGTFQITHFTNLPPDLAGAKPTYNYGKKAFTPEFESDIDKAAYIAAQTKRSPRDADYVAFVRRLTGKSEDEVRTYGLEVKARIKEVASSAEPGVIRIPRGRDFGKLYAPKVEKVAQPPKPTPLPEFIQEISALPKAKKVAAKKVTPSLQPELLTEELSKLPTTPEKWIAAIEEIDNIPLEQLSKDPEIAKQTKEQLYKSLLPTESREPLKTGETWRNKVISLAVSNAEGAPVKETPAGALPETKAPELKVKATTKTEAQPPTSGVVPTSNLKLGDKIKDKAARKGMGGTIVGEYISKKSRLADAWIVQTENGIKFKIQKSTAVRVSQRTLSSGAIPKVEAKPPAPKVKATESISPLKKTPEVSISKESSSIVSSILEAGDKKVSEKKAASLSKLSVQSAIESLKDPNLRNFSELVSALEGLTGVSLKGMDRAGVIRTLRELSKRKSKPKGLLATAQTPDWPAILGRAAVGVPNLVRTAIRMLPDPLARWMLMNQVRADKIVGRFVSKELLDAADALETRVIATTPEESIDAQNQRFLGIYYKQGTEDPSRALIAIKAPGYLERAWERMTLIHRTMDEVMSHELGHRIFDKILSKLIARHFIQENNRGSSFDFSNAIGSLLKELYPAATSDIDLDYKGLDERTTIHEYFAQAFAHWYVGRKGYAEVFEGVFLKSKPEIWDIVKDLKGKGASFTRNPTVFELSKFANKALAKEAVSGFYSKRASSEDLESLEDAIASRVTKLYPNWTRVLDSAKGAFRGFILPSGKFLELDKQLIHEDVLDAVGHYRELDPLFIQKSWLGNYRFTPSERANALVEDALIEDFAASPQTIAYIQANSPTGLGEGGARTLDFAVGAKDFEEKNFSLSEVFRDPRLRLGTPKIAYPTSPEETLFMTRERAKDVAAKIRSQVEASRKKGQQLRTSFFGLDIVADLVSKGSKFAAKTIVDYYKDKRNQREVPDATLQEILDKQENNKISPTFWDRVNTLPRTSVIKLSDSLAQLPGLEGRIGEGQFPYGKKNVEARTGQEIPKEASPYHQAIVQAGGAIGGKISDHNGILAIVRNKAKDAGLTNFFNSYLNLVTFDRGIRLVIEKQAKAAELAASKKAEAETLRASLTEGGSRQKGVIDQIAKLRGEAAKARKEARDFSKSLRDNLVVPKKLGRKEIANKLDLLKNNTSPEEWQQMKDWADLVFNEIGRDVLERARGNTVSEEDYQLYVSRGNDYIPLYRISDQYRAGRELFRSGTPLDLKTSDMVKRLEGSEKFNVSPLEAMGRWAALSERELGRNEVAKAIANWATIDPEFAAVITEVKSRVKPPAGKGLVGFFENGKPRFFLVPEEIADVVRLVKPHEIELITGSLLKWSRDIFRLGTVAAFIPFSVGNTMRDVPSLIFLSKARPNLAKEGLEGFAKNFVGAWLKNVSESQLSLDPRRRRFIRSGAAFSTLLRSFNPEGYLEKDTLFNKLKKGKVISAVTDLTGNVEEATKQLGFDRLMAKGWNEFDAAWETRKYSGSPDFFVMGEWGQYFNLLFPFFNAGLRGTERLFTFAMERKGEAAVLLASFTLMALVSARWNSQFVDENGKPLIDRVSKPDRMKNFVVLSGHSYDSSRGGIIPQYYKIPMPHEAQIIFIPIQEFFESQYKKERFDAAQAALDTLSNILPGSFNLEKKDLGASIAKGVVASVNPALGIPTEQTMDIGPLGEGPMVPEGLKGIARTEQYYPTTSTTAKKMSEGGWKGALPGAILGGALGGVAAGPRGAMIGGTLGAGLGAYGPSPIRTEAGIRRGMGGLGAQVLGALDFTQGQTTKAEGFELQGDEYLRNLPILGNLAIGRFVGTPVDQQERDLNKSFYKVLDRTNTIASTYQHLIKTDPERAVTYLQANQKFIVASDLANKFQSEMAEINAIARMIAEDKTLDRARKTQEMRSLYAIKKNKLEMADELLSSILGADK